VAGATGHVHDHVELLAVEWGQTVGAVALDADESYAIRDRAGDAAGSAYDVVARVACVASDGTAEKHGATEDQEPHDVSCAARRSLVADPVANSIWEPKPKNAMDAS
jgi:hypothetical protein